jgi:hypothetical protein
MFLSSSIFLEGWLEYLEGRERVDLVDRIGQVVRVLNGVFMGFMIRDLEVLVQMFMKRAKGVFGS